MIQSFWESESVNIQKMVLPIATGTLFRSPYISNFLFEVYKFMHFDWIAADQMPEKNYLVEGDYLFGTRGYHIHILRQRIHYISFRW
jgi:hypothetical protein